MKARIKAKPFPGERLYQKRAEMALRLLVRQARAHKALTYKHLAEEMGMSNPRNLDYVLGSIGVSLRILEKNWKEEIPPIQSLVFNGATGIPGEGGQWFVGGDAILRKDKKSRELLIKDAHKRVFFYPRWKEVLDHFGLAEVKVDVSDSRYWRKKEGKSVPESNEHKKLKERIAHNPHLVGLGKRHPLGKTEFNMPSGDRLDILFASGNSWYGVEVKSMISDIEDIRRGLYQCVKYQAVLGAMAAVEGIGRTTDVALAIEHKLPVKLRNIRNTLNVRVVEI